MNVAIIGAGIAGISLGYYLAQHKGMKIDLFDPKGPAQEASGVSTGLLHPFPGKRAMRSKDSQIAMRYTLDLIDTVEKELGVIVASRTGIFRPAISSEQVRDFQLRAQNDQEAIWCEKPPFHFGLWIEGGLTVYPKKLIEGLFCLSQRGGVSLIQERVEHLDELSRYDRVVVAAGVSSHLFRECAHLPIKINKGQALLCKIREPLPFSLVSSGHISLTEDPKLVQVGSTYEHEFHDFSPDPKTATLLLDKVASFYPEADTLEVLDIFAGGRAAPISGYLPIVEELSERLWAFTGLGSRGLLYGPYYASLLSQKIGT